MSISLHKLFHHAENIAQFFILPIGQISEEAQKTRHKDFHRFKEKHIRKITKLNTNFDLLITLLIKSNNKFLTYNSNNE